MVCGRVAARCWFGNFRLILLVDELRVFLVAFGGEADVVKLDFIDSKLGYVLGESDVIILNFRVRGIGPDELAVFTPSGVIAARLDGEFGMRYHQALVAKNSDTGDGVHVHAMQEVHELGHIVHVNLVLTEQWVIEGNRHTAIRVFNIEDHGIAANRTPFANNAQSFVAGSHHSREIDGADFEVFRNRKALFADGGREYSGYDDDFVGFQNVRGVRLMVSGANGRRQLGGRQIRSLA